MTMDRKVGYFVPPLNVPSFNLWVAEPEEQIGIPFWNERNNALTFGDN